MAVTPSAPALQRAFEVLERYQDLTNPVRVEALLSEVAVKRGVFKPRVTDFWSRNRLFPVSMNLVPVPAVRIFVDGGLSDDGLHFNFDGRVVVPIKNARGQVIALTGWREEHPKYFTLASDEFKKETCWFNIDDALRLAFSDPSSPWYATVVVVEGIFDALTLSALGIPCVATMGATVSQVKGAFLEVFDHILCLPDADTVGRRAANPRGKHRWRVPSSAKFILFDRHEVFLPIGEAGVTVDVKDADALFNLYDEGELSEQFFKIRDGASRVSNLDLGAPSWLGG